MEVDPTLPHQIVIRLVRNKIRVSCNCLMDYDFSRKGYRERRFMPGEPKDFEEAKAIYNEPSNHAAHAEAFRDELPTRAPKRKAVRPDT